MSKTIINEFMSHKSGIPAWLLFIALTCNVMLAHTAWSADGLDLDIESLQEDHHDDSHGAGTAKKDTSLYTPSKSSHEEWQVSKLKINTIGPVTPFREKSLTNENVSAPLSKPETIIEMAQFWETLSNAQAYREDGRYELAKQMCVTLLEHPTPEEINRMALIELAYNLEDLNELQKANQVLSQYVVYYNKADNIPEVYLRQGRILRQLGSTGLAIAKFYSAMSSALSVQNSTDERYRRVTLLAQTEIADTQYYAGQFSNAIESYKLILKGEKENLNRSLLEFKLARAKMHGAKPLNILNSMEEYLSRFSNSEYSPEANFIRVSQLHELGRDKAFMEAVLQMLKSQPEEFGLEKEQLVPWQQKAGNLLANSLFDKEDFKAARSVYQILQKMDSDPQWYIPATYQLALCAERLDLAVEATDAYMEILSIGNGLSQDDRSLQVRTLIEMADFRLDQLSWLSDAREKGRSLLDPAAEPGKSQPVDETKNFKWLGSVYSHLDNKTAARILGRLEASETTGILKHMPSARQVTILREISSLGPDKKSLASAVAVALGLPKELANLGRE